MENCMIEQPEDYSEADYFEADGPDPEPVFITCAACHRAAWVWELSAYCDSCWNVAGVQ